MAITTKISWAKLARARIKTICATDPSPASPHLFLVPTPYFNNGSLLFLLPSPTLHISHHVGFNHCSGITAVLPVGGIGSCPPNYHHPHPPRPKTPPQATPVSHRGGLGYWVPSLRRSRGAWARLASDRRGFVSPKNKRQINQA